ncbi:hypothetical protein RB195_021752 [Necator americanus]|uniref:Uncharacterized protein n=1 Tax=Necator americanus TaxID=51031 RepID=A0ABR1ECI1_NECAM
MSTSRHNASSQLGRILSFTSTQHQIRGHPKEGGKNAHESEQQHLGDRIQRRLIATTPKVQHLGLSHPLAPAKDTFTEDDAPGTSKGESTQKNPRDGQPGTKTAEKRKKIYCASKL